MPLAVPGTQDEPPEDHGVLAKRGRTPGPGFRHYRSASQDRADRARERANLIKAERIHDPKQMRKWQDPTVSLHERAFRFAEVAGLDATCIRRLQ
eukprot:12977147-Alexandrium_andersonii.AAC.1